MKKMLCVWMMLVSGAVCAQAVLQDVPDTTVVGPSNDPFLFSVIRGNAAYGTNALAVANEAKTTAVNASNRIAFAEGTINALVSTQRVVVAQMGALVSTQAVQSVTISNAFALGMAAWVKANDVSEQIGIHNGSGSVHGDIRTQIAGVSNLARSAYTLANERPTQDDVRDIIAENENGYMLGQDIPYTGGLRAYLVQNDYLFLPKFYYDSDEGVKNWQVGMSSTSIFFANQSSQVTHLKPDGVAYNGNQSIKWPLAESVSAESPRTFATREWSAEQAAAHVAAPNPHTNSVAWYLRDLGTNGVLVVVSSNAVFSVFQLKE